MMRFLNKVSALLASGERLVVATVTDSSGSTPRSSGAKMAVRESGAILGTVGGGQVEAMACEEALLMLREPGAAPFALRGMDLTSDLAANTDMICGGRLTLCLERLEPGSPALAALDAVRERLRLGKAVRLCTSLVPGREPAHAAQDPAEPLPGEFSCSREAARLLAEADPAREVVLAREGEAALLVETMAPPPALFLFGGGHVSQATARAAAPLGFRLVVLDDRSDFANSERFPMADEVRVLDGFDDCCNGLGVDERSFIVILTRGHLHDKTVLGEALRTPAFYVGMIGSKKKRDNIYDALRSEGFTDEDIARCHSPIGLTIGAQTPEEIAVSICGELIAERAGKRSEVR
jgi:xanthine dehydrogenase accessory factor